MSREAEAIENIADEFDVVGGVGSGGLRDGVVNVSAVILDVKNLEAKRAKSDQVLQQLPHHAGKRESHRQMQNDNSAFAFHPDLARDSILLSRFSISILTLWKPIVAARIEVGAAPFAAD